MAGRALNFVLFLAFLGSLGLYALLGRDLTQRNFEIMPDMAHPVAYDTYAPNPHFRDGVTFQAPQAGAIPRGRRPLHYGPSPQDAVRAGAELSNPFRPGDRRARERGAFVYTNFCVVCHGPTGKGDGPVMERGMPLSPSLLAENAVEMKDGQMFHVLTYGQKTMAAHAGQLSRDDRWKVILYVRSLQRQARGAKQP
jgi:mono/diheme cytochrome c family protein